MRVTIKIIVYYTLRAQCEKRFDRQPGSPSAGLLSSAAHSAGLPASCSLPGTAKRTFSAASASSSPAEQEGFGTRYYRFLFFAHPVFTQATHYCAFQTTFTLAANRKCQHVVVSNNVALKKFFVASSFILVPLNKQIDPVQRDTILRVMRWTVNTEE